MFPKKAFSLLALVGVSAAVWVPQIRSSNGDSVDQSVPVGLELAEPGLLESGEYSGDMTGSPVDPTQEAGQDSVVHQGSPEPGGLMQLLDGNGPAIKVDADLSNLLGSLRSFRSQGTVEVESVKSPGGEAPEVRLGLFEVKLAIDDNPLTAVLIHPKGSRAVMGSRVVRIGDEISPGLTVKSIDSDGVWLDSDAGPMLVSLPAVMARALPKTESSQEVAGSNVEANPGSEPSEFAPGAEVAAPQEDPTSGI